VPKLPKFALPVGGLRLRRFAWQFVASAVFLALLLGHLLSAYQLGFVNKLDAAFYDLKFHLFRITAEEERIVIIDIDEKSLKELGRWPWSRKVMATLSDRLQREYGVATVAYDVLFGEPDRSSGLSVLEELARGPLAGEAGFQATLLRLRPNLDYDGLFAESLRAGPSVPGFYFSFAEPPEIAGELPAPVMHCAEAKALGLTPWRATGYNANLPQIQAASGVAAFFNMKADFDGVARRMPMLMDYRDQCYGSLSMHSVLKAMGIEQVRLRPARGWRPPALDFDGLEVPLDRNAMALVPYRRAGAFRYVSATDVVHGRTPAAELEGRIALLGTTAPGLMDLRVTPLSNVFPGVEIHASLISGILDGTVKWEPMHGRGLEIAVALGLGLLLALWLPFASPLWAGVVTLTLSLTAIALNFYAWVAWNASLPLASVLLAVTGLFVLNMSYGFFVEARSKAQITRLFGQYVPPELVDEMARDPERYSLRGESRVMTVLFSDIRDFTSISEGLEAAQLADMLNVYLSHMTRLIQERRGTIDKYIGDAIMAFWGAPLSSDRHAQDAVLAALAMQSTLAELNPRLEERGWPAVKIGVGVNTGRMSVGNMGSEFRMAYTVMADAVNLASRLEGLTKQYGLGVLCGEDTRAACPDIRFMRIDRVRVKGKQQPVAIYEPLGEAAGLDPARAAEADRFETALDDYQAQRWDTAEATLRELAARNPRKLYDIYLQRIAHFRAEPPPVDWDGVFTFTSK